MWKTAGTSVWCHQPCSSISNSSSGLSLQANADQTAEQVLNVFVACVSATNTEYVREAEVSITLIHDMALGRVWSQTITLETLMLQEAYWQRCSMKSLQPVHRSTTVCHTPLACSQCHPLTQPPAHMYGRVTGRGCGLTERLLSSFIFWRLQHWILALIVDNEATLQQGQPTYSISRHACLQSQAQILNALKYSDCQKQFVLLWNN